MPTGHNCAMGGGEVMLLKKGDGVERVLKGRRIVEFLLRKGGRMAEVVFK